MKKNSDYVGTKAEYKSIGEITGQISPVTDEFTVDSFGRKRKTAYSVICGLETDVKDGDRLIIYGENHSVTSVKHYSGHLTVTAEKEGFG